MERYSLEVLQAVIHKTIEKYNNVFQEQYKISGEVSGSKELSNAINKVIPKQVYEIQSSKGSSLNSEILRSVLETQMRTLYATHNSVKTAGMTTLIESFKYGMWSNGMDIFIENMKEGYIEAADLALLKNVRDLEDFVYGGYPKPIKHIVKNMNTLTAKRLSLNDKLEASVEERTFRSKYNLDSVVDLETMNVMASSTELFEEIEEDELMKLLDVLSNTPELALGDPTGMKIFDIIKDWNTFVEFDQKYYYHARAKRKNGLPYTSDEMGKAPDDCVGSGRFNHALQSHYYFSDLQSGAESEVRKHNRKASVQTVRLKPKRRIQMIDFSEKIKNKNKFLEYIRFSVGPDDKKFKAYLLPQYVASCCINANIEGIKYYGSTRYSNYVSWKGEYFDVELEW